MNLTSFITPAALLILSLGAFWLYIDPTYSDVRTLQASVAEYDGALKHSQELISARDELVQRKNSFSEEDKARLLKLLPDHVDTVRLVLDINSIATGYGMRLGGVEVNVQEAKPGDIVGDNIDQYQTVEMRFSVSTTYAIFRQFEQALETSLRLVDIHSVSFGEPNERGLYVFNISLTTYWLK